MSNNNAKDIILAIESTLTASPSLVNSTTLKEVVIGRSADHSAGFPYLRIYLNDFVSPVEDTSSYGRTYGIAVEIWQELTNKSKRNAELDLANALHKVLDRLGGTWQLGTTVEGTEVINSPIQQVETSAGPMLLAALRLNVLTLIQNAS